MEGAPERLLRMHIRHRVQSFAADTLGGAGVEGTVGGPGLADTMGGPGPAAGSDTAGGRTLTARHGALALQVAAVRAAVLDGGIAEADSPAARMLEEGPPTAGIPGGGPTKAEVPQGGQPRSAPPSPAQLWLVRCAAVALAAQAGAAAGAGAGGGSPKRSGGVGRPTAASRQDKFAAAAAAAAATARTTRREMLAFYSESEDFDEMLDFSRTVDQLWAPPLAPPTCSIASRL